MTQSRPLTSSSSALLAGAALASVLALSACGGGGGSDSDFSLHTTTQAATPSAPITVGGDWMVYLASEAFSGAAGSNLNADADVADQVAFAVNLRSRVETNLGVATLEARILGAEVYLVVDESLDEVDWNGDMDQGDIVLLHWSEASGMVVFVDEVVSGTETVLAAERVFYASDGAPLAVPDENTLRSLSAGAPTVPEAVLGEMGGFARGGALPEVRPIREVNGLLFCALDENADGTDYNGDADSTDDTVLVLLDPSEVDGRLKNVGLALRDDSDPLDARQVAANDWVVAFLVDETAQGMTNLNDQALMDGMGGLVFSQPLLPENCPVSDLDSLDQVLHFLEFADFNMGLSMPVNTGLAGHDRVLALTNYVATISDEDDASCNLNAATGDSDTDDDVARWVALTMPIAPARDPEDLHALATAIGGGSMGLSALGERLVAAIDENADSMDHDGKAANHELVAWIDPADANPTWHFSHQGSNPSIGTGIFDSDGDSEPFAGTSWMAADAVGSRLLLVFLEEVPGTNPRVSSLNTNLDCTLVVKDTDKVDGLPVWADFESGPTLDFDGMGYAVDLANAGLEIADDFAFFRVSESADNRDYNNDGQLNDVVLFRNPLTTCGPTAMATSSLISGSVITTDRQSAAAFLSSESQAGIDFNGDGDMGDLVVRYFRF